MSQCTHADQSRPTCLQYASKYARATPSAAGLQRPPACPLTPTPPPTPPLFPHPPLPLPLLSPLHPHSPSPPRQNGTAAVARTAAAVFPLQYLVFSFWHLCPTDLLQGRRDKATGGRGKGRGVRKRAATCYNRRNGPYYSETRCCSQSLMGLLSQT